MDRASASQVTDRPWAVSTQGEDSHSKLGSSGKPRVRLSSLPAALALSDSAAEGVRAECSPAALPLGLRISRISPLTSPLPPPPCLLDTRLLPRRERPRGFLAHFAVPGSCFSGMSVTMWVPFHQVFPPLPPPPQISRAAETCGFLEERAASQETQRKTFWKNF